MDEFDISAGSTECPIKTIALILHENVIVRKSWLKLANFLCIPKVRIKRFRRDLKLRKITDFEVISDLIALWVGRNGSKATLSTLLHVVEDKCGANNVGENLRLEFDLPCQEAFSSPSIEWANLSPAFQKKVKHSLKQLSPTLIFEEVVPILNGKLLINLMTGKNPNLYKQTIPKELSYYINRRIITRNIISKAIFEQHSPDIFLFTGMNLSKLISLAGDIKPVMSSSEQIKGPTSQFMILDKLTHFERICERTDKPVHLLRYENESLIWVKSRGDMRTVKNCMEQTQIEQNEIDLICEKLKSGSNSPICISHTPGMGKTVLLAHIGRILTKRFPERTVIFLVLGEFIRQFKISHAKNEATAFEEALLTSVCENDLGKAVLRGKMRSEEGTSIELLLDGLDEVNDSDREQALELLQFIKTSFRSIRIWVTTRPHLMEKLEDGLSTLGHNIKPFDESDQLQFLTRLWSKTDKDKADKERLNDFAQTCLDQIKSSLSSNHHDDIAGIPLQCLLIGEVYQEEATVFATLKETPYFPKLVVNIKYITDLYCGCCPACYQACHGI